MPPVIRKYVPSVAGYAHYRRWLVIALLGALPLIASIMLPGHHGQAATLADRVWALSGNHLGTLYLGIAIICAALLMLMPLSPRKPANWLPGLPLLLLPALAPLLARLVEIFGARIVSTPDFSQAVGFAAFLGRPKQDELIVFALLLLCVALVAALILLLPKWLGRRIVPPLLTMPYGNLAKRQVVLLCSMLAAITLANYAALGCNMNALLPWSHIANGDAQGLASWRHAAASEMLPYRDFWLAHGEAWNSCRPLSGDQLQHFIQNSLAFGGFFALLFLLSGGRFIATLLFTGLVWWGAQQGCFQALSRYLLPTNLLLFYLYLQRQRVASRIAWLALGLHGAWVFALEPALALYSAIPALLLAAVLIAQNHAQHDWLAWFWRTHVAALAACVIGIGVFLLALHQDWQTPAFIAFQSDPGALSAVAAAPAAIADWLQLSLRPDNLILLSTLLLLLWGAWLVYWYWKMPEQWLGFYLLLAGCLEFLLVNRYLVQPDTAQQFLVIPLAGLFLYFTSLFGAFSIAHRSLLRLCLVCAAGALLFFSPGSFR